MFTLFDAVFSTASIVLSSIWIANYFGSVWAGICWVLIYFLIAFGRYSQLQKTK